MSFSVTVQPSGRQFSVDADEPVLNAALRQGLVLPYGCRNGACGSCKARVTEGATIQGEHVPKALTDDEAAAGFRLLCCTTALGDLILESRVSLAGQIEVRKLACRIATIDRLTSDVVRLTLQLPANEKFVYLAGQFVELILRDGSRRSYSMATAPGAGGPLELHVRHMPGGRFTDALFGVSHPAVRERDILRLEGPLGSFHLREDSAKPMVLLASGTGFAPIKAMVEDMRARGLSRPATLYWGGRRPSDLYLSALCEQWAREIPSFRYVPVISEALPHDAWAGRTGFVHRAVMTDLPDLSGYQVYACGVPVMVESARRDFTSQCGLPADEFFADSFTSAADLAPVRV